MTGGKDTIFALSSGSLPSGVGLIRVSGPKVRPVLATLIDSYPEPRKATLCSLKDGAGEEIDRGLVLFFPGPASFTGEDVAEFHVHGGRAVVAALLGRMSELDGLRPAEPGEFTRRAFVNGRMDLTEVEGLGDLVAAETEAQRRQAVRQSFGVLRQRLEGWREWLVKARALIEAELDFADEADVPVAVSDEAWALVREVMTEIGRALDDGGRGERLRAGAEVVVTGPVNSGKSSLINALARRDVAIVSAEPGTTRDLIEVHLDVGGYPLTVVDTAGLRETDGVVEKEGIRRGRTRAGAADMVLALDDVTIGPSFDAVAPGLVLRVGTKIDRIDSDEERARLSAIFDVLTSSETGEGLDALVARLTAFARERMDPGDGGLVTRTRHRTGLETCRRALDAALVRSLPLELRAEELRRATDALGRLTGRVDVEDLLDVIFRDFCIGK
ncbi:MAG: tRNA uridine-5-carboxymethylaminomethyl(34) synthesis GTPase MnmE [Bauldia sp.]|nr:tRNA uridine-5-carboxymethylaminomethyl(34) synthesis GTPase MnmE [Verrucomicrobiae bacterium]MCB1501856.1 tRNA uridine-5-carboxymethylaminomethyl(34) synthesis GTPase MnmE [Bauldia sp.]